MRIVKLLSLTLGLIGIFFMLSSLVSNCFKSLENTEAHVKESMRCSNLSDKECLSLAQRHLLKHKYKKGFAMLKNLCKEQNMYKACKLIYKNYESLNERTAVRSELISPYEVLFYLDMGCKGNDMEACMLSANIYDSGLKVRSHFKGTQDGKLTLIDFDKKKAAAYFSKVCNTKSPYTFEACNRLVMLKHEGFVTGSFARVATQYLKRPHQTF